MYRLISGFLLLALGAMSNVVSASSEQGTFVQRKAFAGFNKPFESSGTYTLKDGELVWHTLIPVESILRINSEGVFETSNEAKEHKQSGSGELSALFSALLAHDTQALAPYFKISEAAEEVSLSYTCNRLTPRQAPLIDLFAQVVSCQDKQQRVRYLKLEETNQALTVIELTPSE